ncbi:MAG: hypothetical protein IBJ00_03125 [Alphaproteobacteria bacterium]|nr:hypothetical protein [Alphaproteobacteria bacterium]
MQVFLLQSFLHETQKPLHKERVKNKIKEF